MFFAGKARATDATEVPDNGSEQGMRGGAWVARASDPLAAFYNPAGLAGQPTRLILQSNFGSQRTCFTRIKASNDPSVDGVIGGGSYPQVCSSAAYGVDPQLAMTIRLSSKVGLGIAPLLAPSSASGSKSFPEFTTVNNVANQAEPGRYLLTSQNIVLLTPTVAIGAEILDRLRVGASFQFGIATFSFTNASLGQNAAGGSANADLKSDLSGHDYFIPGFTLGTIWSPTDNLDVAAWYKWTAPVDASGDVNVQYNYYPATAANMPGSISTTDTTQGDCGFKSAATTNNPCGSGGNASVHFSRPMEAKIGLRYHQPRKGIPYDEHLRDPIAQDVFDVEADGTWANDSAMDFLQIRFPGTAEGVGTIPINGTPGHIPPNADVPLHYSDVFGVRVGGDVNVLPDQLALRGGAFYQTPSQTGTNTQYQGLAFATGSMVGLALGGTYRIHFGPGTSALELSAGFEHVFLGTESYDGTGGVDALAGTPCANGANPTNASTCPGGHQTYRTEWAVNLGTITNSVNIINAGLGYRF
jgi:long-chain fatty acid transport protein